MGGGVRGGRKLKAVVPGWLVRPRCCCRKRLKNLGMDFDQVGKAGSMLGSGGVVVVIDGDQTWSLWSLVRCGLSAFMRMRAAGGAFRAVREQTG